MNSRPLVCALTGSTGYVGSLLTAALAGRATVVPLTRRPSAPEAIAWDFESSRDITSELRQKGVTTLIHAAWDMRANSLQELRATCVVGSKRLYQMARAAGVERIIFISTISSFSGVRSAYGKSKLEVEQLTRDAGGIVLRLGLVYGSAGSGGMFGAIRKQVSGGSFLPLIGNGRAPQYLLHAETLQDVAQRAIRGDFNSSHGTPITLAHPQPWPFRDLVTNIARLENRKVTLVPIPWPLLYWGLKSAETLGAKLPVRSDSVISFVYQDPAPDFSKLHDYAINPKPFQPAAVSGA